MMWGAGTAPPPPPAPEPGPGSKDNFMPKGPSDNDQPYEFGRLAAYLEAMPAWTRARMLLMRSRLDNTTALRNRRVKPPKPKKEVTG